MRSLQELVDLVLAKEYEKSLQVLETYFDKTSADAESGVHKLNPEIPASVAHAKIEEELNFLAEFIYRRTKFDQNPDIHPVKQFSQAHVKGLVKRETTKEFYNMLKAMNKDIITERKTLLQQPGGRRAFKLKVGEML